MRLYYSPLSTYSQKVLIALYEKGVAFEPHVVNLRDPKSRAAFLGVHPLGKVPVLVLDDDHRIPESSIIIEFLDGDFPAARLIPAAVEAARKVRFHDRIADLYLTDPTAMLLFNHLRAREYLSADLETASQRLAQTLVYLDQCLADSAWVCGDSFTMADCAVIPSLFYLNVIQPFDELPNLTRYWQAAQQRPSYQQVQEEFLPVWQARMAPQTR
jgi:glutathione S-transferase